MSEYYTLTLNSGDEDVAFLASTDLMERNAQQVNKSKSTFRFDFIRLE